jgi:hypothetical protein
MRDLQVQNGTRGTTGCVSMRFAARFCALGTGESLCGSTRGGDCIGQVTPVRRLAAILANRRFGRDSARRLRDKDVQASTAVGAHEYRWLETRRGRRELLAIMLFHGSTC